jgi:sirohydrochlorin cobaltochelatase
MKSGYLLVSHGSRDPRPQIEIDRSIAILSQRWGKEPLGSATLELADRPLSAQISTFIDRQPQIDRLVILPLFLLPGVHTLEDIPAEIALVRDRIGTNSLDIDLLPHYGANVSTILDLLTAHRQELPDTCLLLSHGSRKEGGNEPVVEIAAKLGINPVYWSVAPQLESTLDRLIAQNIKSIGLLPYFLFPGGITDAISHHLAQLQSHHSQLNILLGQTLSQHPQFIDTIELMLSNK